MDRSTSTLIERQSSFLGHCLDLLEHSLCANAPDKHQFYTSCISLLAAQGKITNSELKDCDTSTSDDNKREDKTYRKWLSDFINEMESNTMRLQHELDEFDLRCLPKLEYVRGVKGRESYYFIAVNPNDPETADESPASPTSPTGDTGSDGIRYRTTMIEHPPWYLKVTAPLFKGIKGRMVLILAILTVFLVLPAMALAAFLLPLPGAWSSYVLVGSTLLFILLMTPAIAIFRIATQKIAIVESIRAPLGTVCLSEVSRIIENGSAVERQISVVSVMATCPVCEEQYQLVDSVRLDRYGFFDNRIIGICLNNPTMHRYTFDKDLMSGYRLPFK